MNTRGHGKIADDVGLPLLVAAFKARGHERIPLNAFPLGNWLTDVQQAVDPVAINAPRVKKFINDAVEEMVNSVFLAPAKGEDRLSRWVRRYQGRINRVIRERQAELDRAVDLLFTRTGAPNDPRRTKLNDGLRLVFRVNGYFRFVHPTDVVPRLDHEPSSGFRMDPAMYFGVFDQLYTQYYPHDHLDRPDIRPPLDPPDFRSDVATGPRATGGSNFDPDLYAYLREDIEIAAGRMARVELDFGVPMFDLSRPPRPTDLDWNLSLGMLGRALHASEDFFAHSLFTEYCLSMLGTKQPTTGATETVGLRMQRWQRMDPMRGLPAPVSETEVVTGWFDIRDTIISLLHMVESVFGARLKDPFLRLAEAREAVVKAGSRPDMLTFDLQQLMYEASETLDDPQKAMQDRNNRVAQRAREFLPSTGIGQNVDEETVRRLLADSPAYRDASDEAKRDMVNGLILIHGAIQIEHSAMSAYKAIKTVYGFFTGPFTTVFGWLQEALTDELKNAAKYYLINRFEAWVGSRRIGSHSLLSKDDEEALLYDPSWQLAAGLHWFVISVLTRQHPALAPKDGEKKEASEAEGEETEDETETSEADKKGKEESEKKAPRRVKATKPRHVDWFDLLEFFLRHPASGGQNVVAREVEACVPIVHIVDNRRRIDSLATLALRYKKSACHRKDFNWRSIADANFLTTGLTDRETQRVVNHVLATSRNGYVVRDGINYAFNPDLPVIIPDQRRMVASWELEPDRTFWWREVIERGTWKVFSGYTDPERRESVAPIDIGYQPQIIGAGKAVLRIEAAEQRRLQREKAYQ